ncbi:hypothetical protein [Rhodopseudomonas palustris]|uniref:hypothetical protein n=1 Tax=Rhodopseudomonas palustris TaxID=1076 RepID=UPI000E5BAB67|nr:hypothetical protein [Rhodopseudomonas palustris]QLH70716.1 hypothetical protein HZF03_07935 [Rhodopseudomonas palustris]RHZ90831.1 hypothetical protein D1920_23800 [Rhodopseudomonas palustris]
MRKNFGILFSEQFRIDANWLEAKGVFNPTLDVDSPLFIDPFLLPGSRHPEFSSSAFEAYEAHFSKICSLLRMSTKKDDKAWKAALKLFQFKEVAGLNGTCLGYSKHSTNGRAFGTIKSRKSVEWAKNVIELGVKDPELFSALALFEEGIGPDLISDMTTKIILEQIVAFNSRITSEIRDELGISLPLKELKIGTTAVWMPENEFSRHNLPVILLPSDVLKHLPIADNPIQIAAAAQSNAELRDRVNTHISEIFKIRTRAEKNFITERAMLSGQAFQALLDALKLAEKTPYDLRSDPEGLIQWSHLAETYSSLYKLDINDNKSLTRMERLENVTSAIIHQFQELVENNRMSEVFHVNGKPRHERFAQLLFLAIAISYCNANNLDISPESDMGAGPVDFKFSEGSDKIVVEIKLSTNNKTVHGYEKQLDAYMKAEKTNHGHFVLIDVGEIGRKWERLTEIARKNPNFSKLRKLHLIDGTLRESASKLM